MNIRLSSFLLLASFSLTLISAVADEGPGPAIGFAGSYDTSGNARDVAVADGYAYIADSSNGLVVVDVSDPANPIGAGGYDTSGYAYGVAVSGDYAYVADEINGLVVVDVSDPANPTYMGDYETSDNARGVAVSGDYAYLADGTGGLVVVGPDSDGDHMADVNDVFPHDPEEWADSDGDGVGDNADPMSNIGIITAWWQVGLILSI